MSVVYKDRVMETTTTTGTGTLTLAGAVAGFQAASVVGNANVFSYSLWAVDANGNPTGDWEAGEGTYTSAGTTLSRDQIFASSNAGAAVNLAAGTKRVALSPLIETVAVNALGLCEFRLTTESGVPVSTSDRTAQGTLYLTPTSGAGSGRVVVPGAGAIPLLFTTAEMSRTLTVTSGKNYDVVLYSKAGVLTFDLMPAWTNDTTRASGVTGTGPVLLNTSSFTSVIAGDSVGAAKALIVGTIRASAANVVEDSDAKRFISNYFNNEFRRGYKTDGTAHTYASSIGRYWNNDSTQIVQFVLCVAQTARVSMSANIQSSYDIGAVLDWTSGSLPSGVGSQIYSDTASGTAIIGGFETPIRVGIGYHYFAVIEEGFNANSKGTAYEMSVGLDL